MTPSALLGQALAIMEGEDVDLLPVVDGDVFVGVVTTTEILKPDESSAIAQASGDNRYKMNSTPKAMRKRPKARRATPMP